MAVLAPPAPLTGEAAAARFAARLLAALSRLLAALSGVLSTLAALLLAALLALVGFGVVQRYVFQTGLLGAEDLGIWLHVAIMAAGAPLALTSALAMRLDVIHGRLSPRLRAAADVLAEALVVVSGLTIAFGSRQVMELVGGTNPGLGLPEWIPFALFAVSGGLVILFTLLRLAADGRWVTLGLALVIGLAAYGLAVSGLRVQAGIPASLLLGLIVAIGLVVAAPLPHAFLAGACLVIPLGSVLPEPAMVNSAVNGMSKFLLLAIPFFLLAGILLTRSGVAARLVRFADAMVGHHRGGLAQTTLLTNVMFSGASGSSIAAAAFGAATFQPELEKRGYKPEQAGAVIAATSVLDNIIPPSIAFLMLATATSLSVGKLLVGGLFAGLLLAVVLFVTIRLTSRETPAQAPASAGTRARLAVGALPAFGLGLIVVLGIRMGIVTTTEAAAVAAIYTLGLGIFGRVGVAGLFDSFRQAAVEAAAIALLIATAAPFAFLLAVDNISGLIGGIMAWLGGGPWAVMGFSILLLTIVGLFLDIGAAILLFGPLLLPLAQAAGIDPIVFGVIIVVNLMIGGLTPPFGVLVFVVAGITRVPTPRLFRAVLPYVVALFLALFAIAGLALIQTALR